MQKYASSSEYYGGYLYSLAITYFSMMKIIIKQNNPRGKRTGIPGPNRKQREHIVINS